MQQIIILISLFSINAFGQIDTPRLLEFNPSRCDSEINVYRIQNRIVEQNIHDDTLKIVVAFMENCAFEAASGSVDFSNDTLFLYYSRQGVIDTLEKKGDSITIMVMYSYYECDCCFTFEYLISDLPDSFKQVMLNDKPIFYSPHKYKVQPIKYKLSAEGDTINYVDIYGFRQGFWYSYNSDNKLINHRYYYKDKIIYGTDYQYYPDGKTKAILTWENGEQSRFLEFYENGNIKSDCQSIHGPCIVYEDGQDYFF
jgi:hypothetical protein